MRHWTALRSWAWALALALPGVAPAAPAAIVTIADGDAVVLRDTGRFAAAEGLRLRADDILSTGEAARLLRVELDDGRTVDLGPATQVMLLPRAPAVAGRDGAPTVYVMSGWVKLSSPAKGGVPAALATPRVDAARVGGTLIANVSPEQLWLFAESGSAELQRRRDGKAAAAQPLLDGDSFVLPASAGNGPGSVSRLPPAALRGQVPRGFLDTLPRRAERFASRSVEPGRITEVAYAEIAPWVNGEPALRAALVQRLTPRAKDNAFRQPLVAELKLHPEWQNVLFPPPPPVKRTPPVAVAAAAAKAASAATDAAAPAEPDTVPAVMAGEH